MKSHELARILLTLPDLSVVGEEDEYGYSADVNSVKVKWEDIFNNGDPTGILWIFEDKPDDISKFRQVIHISSKED